MSDKSKGIDIALFTGITKLMGQKVNVYSADTRRWRKEVLTGLVLSKYFSGDDDTQEIRIEEKTLTWYSK